MSVGWVKSSWELHLTGFGPDVVRYLGSTERGGAGMLEVRVGDATALGVNGRVAMTDDRYRYIGGVFGKTYFESAKSLIQTELNLVHSTFPGGHASPPRASSVTWASRSSPVPASGSRRSPSASRPASPCATPPPTAAACS